MTEQIRSRKEAILNKPLASMDQVLEQEYMKGEAIGIEFARLFAHVQIGVLTDQINEILEEQENAGRKQLDAQS